MCLDAALLFKMLTVFLASSNIRALYKGYKIIEVDWKYGMNATKKSSEIVIIGRSTHVEEIVGAMVKRVIQRAAA